MYLLFVDKYNEIKFPSFLFYSKIIHQNIDNCIEMNSAKLFFKIINESYIKISADLINKKNLMPKN